jgi:hypothetical protein
MLRAYSIEIIHKATLNSVIYMQVFTCPQAASPATPPPITNIFAGGTFPAAVICPVKNLPN